MSEDRDRLIRDYKAYDARCDIVSCFEVFFAHSQALAPTVRHFERYPSYEGPDGNTVTPDFTVLFTDDTLLVGELANLARHDGSLESLLKQIGRYDSLRVGPSASRAAGGHDLSEVSETDVLVLIPAGEANAASDRIDEAIQQQRWDYAPNRRPTVFGYSYDVPESRYIFTYDDRSGNPRPQSHGRRPSLEGWLIEQSDTLRCRSRHFGPVKLAQRFMNDRPPVLYMATLLWLDVLPGIAAPEHPPIDLNVTTSEVATWLRSNYGWGDADSVRSAFDFLRRAGLARERQHDWAVALGQIASGQEQVRDELVDRYLARPKGPVTAQDRVEAEERRERDARLKREGEEGASSARARLTGSTDGCRSRWVPKPGACPQYVSDPANLTSWGHERTARTPLNHGKPARQGGTTDRRSEVRILWGAL